MSIIIIGGGEIGRYIAEKLIEQKKEVIIIERNERIIDELEEDLDAKFVVGNGAAPHILREAGISGAEMVLAVTNSDEVNLLASMLSSMQAPLAKRVARLRDPDFDIEEENILEQLKLDLVINPDKEAARAILKILEVPGTLDVMEFFDGGLKLVGTEVKRQCELINRPLSQLKEFSCLLAAIVRGGQLIIPTGESKIMPKDQVYFVAESKKVRDVLKIFGHETDKVSSIMISGGGFIGMNLASSLEAKGANVKVVESDPKLCSVLSRNLNKTVILNASSTDQDFLEDENIDKMDAFVAVTKDDEDNILSALLAKRLGCTMTITLSHNRAYHRLINAVGIDVVVNPRQLASNTILHFIRKGNVLHASSIMDAAEFIEVKALPTSELVKKPIHKLDLPKGVIVLSIKRGDQITVPGGDTVIEPDDRVLFIVRHDAIGKLEKLIEVGFEYF
ncbi:MAG: Trk system potassium transporter TrkA [Pseudomonadota bacterium]